MKDCTYGLRDFSDYFGGGAGFVPLANKVEGEPDTEEGYVERYNAAGGVVIGTPDDAIEYIEGLIEQSGGFGTFLMLGHDWASPERTLNSYRLIAEKVMPHFQGQLASPRASHEWATENRGKLFGRSIQAMGNAIQSHVAEQEKDAEAAQVAAENGEVEALMRAASLKSGQIYVKEDARRSGPWVRAGARRGGRRAASAAATSTSPSTAPR